MSLAAFTWTTRARPVVELGVGDSRIPTGQATWDHAHWDTDGDRWAGNEPTWHDITCDTISLRCEYGRRHTTDRFVAGVATVTVNNDSGWADPHAAGPPTVLTIRPGRPIRFGVVHAVYGTRWLYRGFVDAVVPQYVPNGPDLVQFDCVDALGEVNRAKLVPQGVAINDGETVTSRLNVLLDFANWPPIKRDLWPTSIALVGDEMGGQIADLLSKAADSGGGVVFGDLDANVAFRPRDWQVFAPGEPVDATIGNVEPADVCPVAWERPFARADMATLVILGRDPESAVSVEDPAGQILYGIEPFEQTDLLTKSDGDLLVLANRILRTRSASSAPRVRSVTLDARTADNALDLMSTVSVWEPSRYRCRLRYPRGDVFDAEHFATGAVHELDAGHWTLNLNLDLADPFRAVGGRWDGAYWDQALWADVVASAEDLLAEIERNRKVSS